MDEEIFRLSFPDSDSMITAENALDEAGEWYDYNFDRYMIVSKDGIRLLNEAKVPYEKMCIVSPSKSEALKARFRQELSGALGDFWLKDARKEFRRIKGELESGEITIDSDGVARNCIGRALMSDMREKLTYVTDKFSVEATAEACDEESAKAIAEYRKNYKGPSEEELFEMRAAFESGATVVNVFTSNTIQL